ncbi:HrpB1 family type III secretion system apparatus protein [Rhizobacter sp. LjRoot28]|jgi:type III secretion protein HrpB1|uniref:HrpB1 family type III secretion system apparatus protein n=1 Tax=Rhizobacter sp. LjRoot28 TaxID=3342309 RepID=UPI003ED09F95
MTSAPTDKPLVDALAAIFYVGSELEADEQTLPVLRLIRRLRPDSPKLAVVEAQQLIECGDLQGARLLLDEADERSPDTAIVKAMLALVLQQQRNGLWVAYAEDARGLPADPKADSILEFLDRIARGDPFEATEEAAEEEATAAPATTMPFMMSQYMGVAC